MNPDSPARALAIALAVLLLFTTEAAALTVDLGETREEEPLSLGVSRTDANRIEFPETIINAFSSSESMDVKIIGRSALVRTEDPAELIVLTEKRRLTLLLVPEDVPSRTVIMRAGDAPSGAPGKGTGELEPLPYEKAITDLVLSLASDRGAVGRIKEKELKLADSLFLTLRAEAASPPFSASLYVVRNGGGESAPLRESMFSADPGTVAVGMERDLLPPGESARIFVVTRKEPPG